MVNTGKYRIQCRIGFCEPSKGFPLLLKFENSSMLERDHRSPINITSRTLYDPSQICISVNNVQAYVPVKICLKIASEKPFVDFLL